ncbi:MAG TPA: 3-phosphoshikimate 1-carboxyvinyltransferase [Candidatus Lachnoclostridium pullistercoris]|uniref:3-phosphoshikimate 1-carboxyvinyltransferase n=1 Tax=Candidatus Lachnoclostridium pullistercoris TaxID=2838632 RepID=A0A9D2T716_9FIRM|nr:3-phosphoshikimate 1-carboxyvinyltransferase [Candidatus Lachnoclostridium pullistercoris]
MKFSSSSPLRGCLNVPGDKSISHRSVMFGALAKGTTEISNFLKGADCLSTISCFRSMGVDIQETDQTILVRGKGLHGLRRPDHVLDCGNSGTTTRLISGILAGQDFDVTLTGDESIQKRPMKRIIEPLSLMGAHILSVRGNDCAPLSISGSHLHGISYSTPVASAQVKSAILLAGLYADGETRVTEPARSRNHTELMLASFGADVKTEGTTAIIRPAKELFSQSIQVPGDISSAAFFMAAALLVPGSEVLLKNVGINPTRDGVLRVFRQMGGEIETVSQTSRAGEPAADLLVRSSRLHGTEIGGDIIPTLIDELPVIAAAACFADGVTVIRDAAELKVKESNRIQAMAENLTAMGADVTETEDGMIIRGGKPLHGAVIDSRNDHRIAMTFAVAALASQGEVSIPQWDCVNISYPAFLDDLRSLMG